MRFSFSYFKFLVVAFFAWLWGIAGALLAAPLLIVSHSVWRRMSVPEPRSSRIGHRQQADIDGPFQRQRPEPAFREPVVGSPVDGPAAVK